MEEAYNYLYKSIGIKYNDTVVAAISGGPDSMALLHLLIRLKKALDITIVCAHVNHKVRKESDDELIFVRDYCLKNGVVFESMEINNYSDDNFHNESRSIRYQFFNDLIQKHQAKYLFTAHHADDLMETILMRLVRGSTLKGYAGFEEKIAYQNYTLVRPLIHVTKDDIYSYLAKHKLKYVTDNSNFKDVYTRNRFRKIMLPFLKNEDPMVHDKFYKFSRLLLEYNNYINKQIESIIPLVYNEHILNIEEFLKQDEFIRTKILYYLLEKYYQDDLILLTDRHVTLLYQLITSKKANARIHLPNNIEAIKTYNTLTFQKDVEEVSEYEIEISDYVTLPHNQVIERVNSSQSDGNDICRLNRQDIKLPLYVRTKKDGDKMTVKGMLGSKKISDIFIDSKIPLDKRNLWPIVCDSDNHIVWLPGLKKSKFCKEKHEKCDIILKYY